MAQKKTINRKTCPSCDGSGQISYFKGVSRFLLSVEECPECGGLGFVIEPDSAGQGSAGRHKKKEKE